MRPAFEALFKLAELEIQRGPSEAERGGVKWSTVPYLQFLKALKI